ncbi:MAG: hypothetical protein H3C54_13435 [Taibaiella sp.]|nr:hypothetical protein [Taibaiella sp.]
MKLVTLFHKKNDVERTRLNENKKLIVTSRNDFFDYAVALIESAERSLLAVDFIPPELWISDPLVVAYADAHRGLKTFEKQRIHIYQTETLDAEKKAAYRNYIELMDTLNIELFFLEEKLMDTNQFEKRGSLIIDNCCCIIVINPDIGAKFGEIEFNQISIGDYEKRFRTLKKIAKPKADFQLLLT